MAFNIRIVSTYPPRRCGIGTFSRDLANALASGTFDAEVGQIRVAAIDNGHGPYDIPVDFIIHQYDPASWRNTTTHICTRAAESTIPTVVALQHEFGLDPDPQGNNGQGRNFVDMAKALRAKGLSTVVYLHTLLKEPDPHQRATIQDLAANSDGLIVMTDTAVHMLESESYGIDQLKARHIDHGVRMQYPYQLDRREAKREYGLENCFVVMTLGFLSPDKGVQYAIRAYAKFLHESCTEDQRKELVYLIVGPCHPEFVKFDGGKSYRQYQATLNESLRDASLRWCYVKDLRSADFEGYDLVFCDAFLDDHEVLQLYGLTDVMVLPYLNMQQTSSGILADTVGTGRVAIATKFIYAVELLSNPGSTPPKGIVFDKRGILVDPGEPSVDQIAMGLDFVAFNAERRLRMEELAYYRGHQMSWQNAAWGLLQYLQFFKQKQSMVNTIEPRFVREKTSSLDSTYWRRVRLST